MKASDVAGGGHCICARLPSQPTGTLLDLNQRDTQNDAKAFSRHFFDLSKRLGRFGRTAFGEALPKDE